MAMDFPNSPTNGTTYTQGSTTWTYDGSKWNRVVGTIQGVQGLQGLQGPTPSIPYQSSAPLNPTAGNLWANSTDGLVYVYNGTSWVSVMSPTLGDQTVLMARIFV